MTHTKKCILVVEDEDAMGRVLCEKLERCGFQVVRCSNGKEAIDALVEEQFDAILLDLVMPGKDGFSVLAERGATRNSQTPVYLLTNLCREDVMQKAAGLGARDCFIKTRISLGEIAAKMKKELGVA